MSTTILGMGLYDPPRTFFGRSEFHGRFADRKPKMHRVKNIHQNTYEVEALCGYHFKYLITRVRNVMNVPKKDRCERCEAINAQDIEEV